MGRVERDKELAAAAVYAGVPSVFLCFFSQRPLSLSLCPSLYAGQRLEHRRKIAQGLFSHRGRSACFGQVGSSLMNDAVSRAVVLRLPFTSK